MPSIGAADDFHVLEFGYNAYYRGPSAYRFAAADDNAYVHDTVRGQGIGKPIYAAVMEHSGTLKVSQMMGVIGRSGNVNSFGVHAGLGYVPVGTPRKVGYKFDRRLDVVTMQKVPG
jgi:L-amino acid N-acyltransferase YncA